MRGIWALLAVCATTALADQRTEAVDKLFSWVKPDGPGCAIGVFQDGRVLYKRGFGLADLEHGVAITPASSFYLASVSKQFTAAAVAILASDGKLSLDDPVRKHIPELPAYSAAATIRHLIHHTSGFRDYLSMQGMIGRPDNYYTSDADVLALMARQKALNFAPGAEHLYSNTGYVLLSMVVKRVSGKSLREFAAERIFRPLGMTNTRFHDDHREPIPQRAVGYSQRGNAWRIDSATLDVVGDGGAFSTIDDLAQWEREFVEPRLEPRDLIPRMLQTGVLSNGGKLQYAFGLGINEYRGLPMIAHAGSLRGYRTDRIHFPDQKFGVTCLCNASSGNAARITREIAAIYLGDKMKPAPPAATPPKPQEPPTVVRTPGQLAELAGRYYSEELDTTWDVRMRDGKLWMVRANGQESEVSPGSRLLQFTPTGLTVNDPRARGIVFTRVK